LSDEESLLASTALSSPQPGSPSSKRIFEMQSPVYWDPAAPSKRSKISSTTESGHFWWPRQALQENQEEQQQQRRDPKIRVAKTAWQLPEELLVHLFMILDDPGIALVTEVCTTWCRLAQTDDMYRHRCLLRWGPSVSLSAASQDGMTTSWRQLYLKRRGLLRNKVICSTFFKQVDKAEFKRKVVSLGGTYSDHFTMSVTHLIASRVGSCKYQLAMRLGLPVVTQEWLDRCFETSMLPSDCAFRLLPLSGCCITVTGLSQADRSIVEQTAKMFGAEFSPDLRRNRTTHLIAASARGAKYDAAIRWGDIQVVRPKWFFDSIVRSMCMQEQLYSVTTGDQPSTPPLPA